MKKTALKIAAGVAALSMWAGAPFAAHALASWSTAVDVSKSGFLTSDPEIAIDADGVMTAIWSHVGVSTKTIQVSTSSDGQDWTDPVDVSPLSHEAIQPHLVVDGTGRVTVIWMNEAGDYEVIWSSKRESNATSWSEPVQLSGTNQNTSQAQLVVDSAGAVTTIFNNRTVGEIQSRTSDNGAAWTNLVTLDSSPSSYLGQPQIAVDGSGRVTAVWRAYDSDSDEGKVVARSSVNPGVWSGVTTLFGGGSRDARVAATESGLTTVTAFSDFSEVEIQSRSSQDGGDWSTAAGHGPADGSKPNVSVVGSETVVITFRDNTVGGIWASSTDDGVQWTTAQLIDGYADDYSYGPSSDHVAKVIADSSGQLTAVWMRDYTTDYDYPHFRVAARTSTDGITWTEPVELAGTSSYSANLVVNSDCRVTALFELSDGTENTVQSRTLDNGGCPAVAITSAPRSLRVGPKTATSRKLVWKTPASLNGNVITDYVIQFRVNGTNGWSTFTDGISTSRKVKVTGLTKGVKYQFQVAARTAGGDSPYSVATRAR